MIRFSKAKKDKIKYDVTIICTENDLYLGDLICQELEALGKRCLFNLRDAPRPDVLHNFIDKSPIYIAIVNKDFFNTGNGNFVRLTKHESGFLKKPAYLFVNEDGVKILEEWGSPTLIDANSGWDDGLMAAIANGLPVDGLCKSYVQNTAATTIVSPEMEIHMTNGSSNTLDNNPNSTGEYSMKNEGKNMEEKYKIIWNNLGRHKIDRMEDLILPEAPESMMVRRAMKYYIGDGVVQDSERAYTLLQKAVKEEPEDVEALYYLAAFNETGEGCSVDLQEAFSLYEVALEKGLHNSLLRLGYLSWVNGDFEMKSQGLEIIKKCRKAGDVRASYWLGLDAEMKGEYEDAFEYYSEAAEEGYPPAQNAIGGLYYIGRGVKQDKWKAMEWVKLAAEKKLPVAIANYGNLLMENDVDWDEGQKLIKQAYEIGDEAGLAFQYKVEKALEYQREVAAEERRKAEKERKKQEWYDRIERWLKS